jgi:hypothetical protein
MTDYLQFTDSGCGITNHFQRDCPHEAHEEGDERWIRKPMFVSQTGAGEKRKPALKERMEVNAKSGPNLGKRVGRVKRGDASVSINAPLKTFNTQPRGAKMA